MPSTVPLRDDYDATELRVLAKCSRDPRQIPRLLAEAQMAELAEIVVTDPDPAIDGVVRWRRIDLKRVIEERFGVVYSERAMSDLLAALSFSHINGRRSILSRIGKCSTGKKLPPHARSPHRPSAQGQAH